MPGIKVGIQPRNSKGWNTQAVRVKKLPTTSLGLGTQVNRTCIPRTRRTQGQDSSQPLQSLLQLQSHPSTRGSHGVAARPTTSHQTLSSTWTDCKPCVKCSGCQDPAPPAHPCSSAGLGPGRNTWFCGQHMASTRELARD